MRQRLLGIAFLSPALIAAALFFLLPVLLTAAFSFTSMSTATGIMGGEYVITQADIRDLPESGVSSETVERVGAVGYRITEPGVATLAAEFSEDIAEELRDEDLIGEMFEARRDLERVLRDVDHNRELSTRERKDAADLFQVGVVGERYPTQAEFRDAIAEIGVPAADHDRMVEITYTGWTWTVDNFTLLAELPSTLRYAMNTAFYVACTLAFNVLFGLFLAITTFYLPVRLANTFRTIWFLPRILPPVMYVLMWNWFTWDTGFLSIVGGWLGLPQINWMMHTATHAWTVVILINGFVGASLGMIIFSSAIRSIPQSMLYASEVDGANRWQQVRYIILPQLRWPILFITSFQTLSLLTSFEYILLATDGGPGSTTEVWALAAFHTALNNYGGNLEYGLGAAYALGLVFIGIIASAIYLRVFNFKELLAKPRIEQ